MNSEEKILCHTKELTKKVKLERTLKSGIFWRPSWVNCEENWDPNNKMIEITERKLSWVILKVKRWTLVDFWPVVFKCVLYGQKQRHPAACVCPAPNSELNWLCKGEFQKEKPVNRSTEGKRTGSTFCDVTHMQNVQKYDTCTGHF